MQWVSRSNHMGSIPVRVTMKRLPTPLGVGSLFISGLPVRESPGCPRCQFPTVISSKSLLPLQCPVSLPGGNRCKDPSPPCQRGVVLPMAKPGGFRRLAGFHMGLYFGKVPAVNPSVTANAVPAPFDKGAFGVRKMGALQNLFFATLPLLYASHPLTSR